MDKINILYLHSHDTGRYISPYGLPTHTPNLQNLAEQGILFRQAFCAAPTSSPSRAALLTGQYPHSCGMTGLANRGFSLDDYSKHLVPYLRENNYTCALAGVQHEADRWNRIGYDTCLGDCATAHQSAAQYLSQKPQVPFFLSVGFNETHRPFQSAGPEFDPAYTAPPAGYPDLPEIRKDMADYYQSAANLDSKMGTVLDALEKSGLAKNTLVICTTDHGLAFPGMKCNLNDRGIGVMLIMRGPAPFEGGKVIDALVSQIDIFPTLCEYANIPQPDWNQGVSLMPLLTGESDSVREEIFAEVNFHAAYEPIRCMRTDRLKYIRRFSNRNKPVPSNCDDSPSKSLFVDNGWLDIDIPSEELYDLFFDPLEIRNLASEDGAEPVLEMMRESLTEWMTETGDPLLNGPLTPPPGTRVNNPDHLSANLPPRSY